MSDQDKVAATVIICVCDDPSNPDAYTTVYTVVTEYNASSSMRLNCKLKAPASQRARSSLLSDEQPRL